MTQLSAIVFALFLIHSTSYANTPVEQPHPGPRSAEQAKFLFEEAQNAERDGKEDLAIEDYQKILKTYPQFPQKFAVYQALMKLQLAQKKYDAVLSLGKEAILQHPGSGIYSAIQLLRAEAQLQAGKALQSRMIVDELLKSKPDANSVTAGLLIKAEALSQLGKHKDAFAALDAAKGNDKYSDAELKIRSRACSSRTPQKKEPLLDYFHEKNLCFKEAAALARSMPAKDSAQTWCERFSGLEAELKKSKLDEFTIQKLKSEMEGAKALSAPWGCL